MNYSLTGNQPHTTNRTNRTTNRYTIHTPALLQTIGCYSDASMLPAKSSPMPREAGIGVFIVNTQVQPTQTIYIKAKLTGTSSVLMPESAALALAATVTDCMNVTNVNFLSDCEQLVHFLNAADQSYPPDWRIKYFTQLFSIHSRCRLFKITRSLNTTVDALARQALSASES